MAINAKSGTTTCEVRLFGGFDVRVDGNPLPSLRSRREQWLLALLVLRQDRDTAREWLATTLWPDSDEKQALFYLRKSLSNLRQALGTEAARLLSPTPRTVRLDVTGALVDAVAFDNALKRVPGADDPTPLLQEAVTLYRGPLLPDCLEEWAVIERNQREQAYLTALESLAVRFQAQGDPATAVHWLRLLTAADPYRENAYRSLMQALADCGDLAAVTVVYQELRSRLRQELNAAPSPETETLYRQVRQQERQPVAPAPPITPGASRRHLPVPLSDLIGRQNEIAEVLDWLEHRRLVTLLGAGGIGKTRLAIAAAEAVLPRFEQGAWFVDLAALSDVGLVPQATAKALGVAEEPGRLLSETLADSLAPRSLLLVLDNCEHLLEACGTLAYDLLSACPGLRILATSRQALDVMGEQVYRVPSLLVPPHGEDGPSELDTQRLMEYEAVRLFVERAVRVSSGFRLTPRNASAVVEICRQLDGIPLAIEMAAVRLRSLSVSEVNARLEDRFRLLTSGNRGVLPRHQTLRAAIDWSYDQLFETERGLLRRLAVFAGGWTWDTAEAVCADSLLPGEDIQDLLSGLADKSLVVAEAREEATRYRLLETVRQYAWDRLEESAETGAVRTRHRDYFVALAEKSEPQLRGPEQAHYAAILEEERDNLRTALAFCLDTPDGAEPGLRLGQTLWRFWADRGYLHEGQEHLLRVLGHAKTLPLSELHADVLYGAGILTYLKSDYAASIALHEECLAVSRALGYQRGIAMALNGLGTAAIEQSDYTAARTYYEEGVAIQRALGNKPGIAMTLVNIGRIATQQGDYAKAHAVLEESLSISRELGDAHGIARSLYLLGIVAHDEGDPVLCRALVEESLAMRRELGHRPGIAEALSVLAAVVDKTGEFDYARALHEEALATHRAVGNKWGLAAGLLNFGSFMKLQGDNTAALSLSREGLALFAELRDKRAIAEALEAIASLSPKNQDGVYSARLWGAASALRDSTGAVKQAIRRPEMERDQAGVREAMGETAFTAAWDQGRALPVEEAIAYALER